MMTPKQQAELLESMANVEYHDVKPTTIIKPGVPYIVKEGVLDYHGYKIRCYVLNTGVKCWDADDFEKYMPNVFKNGHEVKKDG